MNLLLIDSHAHAQFPAYDADRDQVLRRALDAGIGVINIGTQYSTSVSAVRLAENYPQGVWATAGFHPHHADLDSHHDPWELPEKNQERFEYEKFLELARHPKVVAVGECGLDYAHFARERRERLQNGASAEASGEGGLLLEEVERKKRRQKEIFMQQIELAKEVRKPLVIHCRRAFADLIDILTPIRYPLAPHGNGVVHFFSGSWGEARKLLELGFYLSFAGPITFARDYDETIKKAPLDRLLAETDAPYASPLPYRGKRNEPAYVVEVARKISELRGMTFEEIAALTAENARKLFNLRGE